MRKGIEVLNGMLAALPTPQGEPIEIALTTNATLLRQKAQSLKDAGLERVTVSLDALEDQRFQHMSDSKIGVARVLAGIEKAHEVGLRPVQGDMEMGMGALR